MTDLYDMIRRHSHTRYHMDWQNSVALIISGFAAVYILAPFFKNKLGWEEKKARTVSSIIAFIILVLITPLLEKLK